jgi:hypothetical protein
MIHGVDISEWQGDPDWRALRTWLALGAPDGEDVSFLMLRSEDGMRADGRFSAYCKALSDLGFSDLGTYVFFRASQPVLPQILHALACHGDLPGPLALDVETLDGTDPAKVADRAAFALAELERQSGRTPMIYTDPGDWSRLGAYGKSHDFERFPLWVATIGPRPLVPPPWNSCAMWQYTWRRTLAGFSSPIDADVFYGTIEEWRALGRERAPDSTPTGH